MKKNIYCSLFEMSDTLKATLFRKTKVYITLFILLNMLMLLGVLSLQAQTITCPSTIYGDQCAGTEQVIYYPEIYPCDPNLETVLHNFNTYYSQINAVVPNQYFFTEGDVGNYISDGGNDMYDDGNFLNVKYVDWDGDELIFWDIPYSDNVIVDGYQKDGYTSNGIFGFVTGYPFGGPDSRYFTRKVPGLFLMAADIDTDYHEVLTSGSSGIFDENNIQKSSFFTTGNLGADGLGNTAGSYFTISGQNCSYKIFYKLVFNAFDPSILHLMIIPDAPSDIYQEYSTSTDSDFHQLNEINNTANPASTTRIYYLLVAGESGYGFTYQETVDISRKFIQVLGNVQQTGGLASGSVFPLGVTTNTYTASDNLGNVTTCSFDVDYGDQIDPVMVCPNDMVLECPTEVDYGDIQVIDDCVKPKGLYVRDYNPWNNYENDYAMGCAFNSAGGWDYTGYNAASTYFTDAYNVIFLEGSDYNATALNNFLATNINLIESWVADGNTLFINAAPSQGGNIDCGFGGVMINYPNLSSSATVVNVTHPMFNGSLVGSPGTITGPLSGSSYSNATITGGNTMPLMTGSQGVILSELSWGNGHVLFGGMTTENFHSGPGAGRVKCNAFLYLSSQVQFVDQEEGLASGSFFGLGETVNKFKTQDLAGNSASCSFRITVADLIPPTITCPNDILLEGCDGIVVPFSPTFSDNCEIPLPGPPIAAYVQDSHPWGHASNVASMDAAFGLGNWILSDYENAAALFSSAHNVIFLEGSDENFTAFTNFLTEHGSLVESWVASGNTLYLNAAPREGSGNGTANFGFGGITLNYIEYTSIGYVLTTNHPIFNGKMEGSTGSIEGPIIGNQFTHGRFTNAGGSTTLMANDDNEILLLDLDWNLGKVVMGALTSELFHSGSGSGLIKENVLRYLGNSRSIIQISGTVGAFPVGTTINTFRVIDVAGATATCSFSVTIEDNTLPTAQCKDVSVVLDETGSATVVGSDVDDQSSDPCGALFFDLSKTQFDCNDMSGTGVVLTVTDANGNSSTCPATVTTIDIIPPDLVCPVLDLELDNVTGTRNLVPTDIAFSTNDCGVVPMSIVPNAFDCSHLGGNLAVLEVEDASGNTAACTFDVLVTDNTLPTAICQNIDAALDANGDVTINGMDVNNGSVDNCNLTYTLNYFTFDCDNRGIPNIVELTAEDESGNVSFCTADIKVVDPLFACCSPGAFCKDIEVSLDADGGKTIEPLEVEDGDADNCTIISSSLDINSFGCADVGDNTVNLTIVDINELTMSCSAKVTVLDEIAPVPVCQTQELSLDINGEATLDPNDLDNGTYDACAMTFTSNVTSFDCSQIGNNTAILIATDASGNVSICPTSVFIKDEVSPTMICQNIVVELDNQGIAIINEDDVDGGTNDACGIAMKDVSTRSFYCADVGDNTVVLSAEDVNGNSAQCTATVTVEENIAPAMVCSSVDVYLDVNGQGMIAASDVDGGSADNCSFGLSLSKTSFTCADLGTNTVMLTGTDVNTNSATCPATVNVYDDRAPTMACVPFTIILEADGTQTITTADVDAGTTDNCSFVLAVAPSSFDCSNVGFDMVELEGTDTEGNVATCTSVVQIIDVTPATAKCKDIVVQLDENGATSIVGEDIDDGSSDVCGVAGVAVAPNAFDCSHTGSNVVVLTVTDLHGNTSTCAATVTVEDPISPIAVCQTIVVELDEQGEVSIDPADVNNGSADVCTAVNLLNVVPNAFVCGDVGSNTVVLSIEDAHSNGATCEATVIVQDNIAPEITCPADIQTCDLDGFAEFDMPTASDNCGIATITTDYLSGSLFSLGTTVVTGTAEDINGNRSTCEFTINFSPLTVSISSSDYNGHNVSCLDAVDGTATVTAIGGFGNYTYNWSNGDNTATATNLGAGTHTVEVTSDLGCSISSTIVFDEPNAVNCSTTSSPVSCFGEMDGIATLFANGGVAGFTYNWTGPNNFTASTATITNLAGGDYTATATDANGCACSSVVTVLEAAQDIELVTPLANAAEEDCIGPFCFNVISFEICGGTLPYDINWPTGSGFYRYAVEYDYDTGCVIITVKYSDAANWSVNIVDESNCGSSALTVGSDDVNADILVVADVLTGCANIATDCTEGGSIELVVEGGNAPYNYLWAGPGVWSSPTVGTATISNLPSGWFYATITDSGNPPQHTLKQVWVGCEKPGRSCGSAKETGEELRGQEQLVVYPNPLSEQATIDFQVDVSENVTVEIFNIEGKQVARLFDARAEKGEEYNLVFDAADKAAGIYICRLTTESDKVLNQRIVILNK